MTTVRRTDAESGAAAHVKDRRARIALVHGEDRVANVQAALAPVLDEIDWPSRRHVVVKPNLVIYDAVHAITHRATLAATLAAVRARYAGPLTIAEGCAIQSSQAAFVYHDYAGLGREFDCELVDLNEDEVVDVTVLDRRHNPLHIRLARTVYASDCRISLTLPKTHDTVLMTGAIKNMIMASLVNRRVTPAPDRPDLLDRLGRLVVGHGNHWGSDKIAMHQSYPIINLNLAALAPLVMPHVALHDGFVAMEGDGPVYGDPVDWRLAVAGTDALAVDALVANLMGFAVEEIGYLAYCQALELGNATPDRWELLGNVTPAAVRRPFRRHSTSAAQSRWQIEGALEILRALASPTAAGPDAA